MVHRIFRLACLFTLLSLVAACAMPAAALPPAEAPAPTAAPVLPTATPTPEVFRNWVKGAITSPALAENLVGDPSTKRYAIYLPPSYPEGNKRYPVVYALHGYLEDESGEASAGFLLDQMIRGGKAPEMIFVFPDISAAFKGSWFLDSPAIGNYETYITHELVEFIDANFRTIPQRDSRGVTGCSMGGDGALYLGFRHPDVFGVVAGMTGIYDYEHDKLWQEALGLFSGTPSDFAEFRKLPWQVQLILSKAAATASNPDKPPFYFDMPFEMVDGEARIVPEVAEKINSADPLHALPGYLAQPTRLRGMMIYHGEYDTVYPVQAARSFSETLAKAGVEHEYLEVTSGHCIQSYQPVIEFMVKNLSFESFE